MGAGNSKNLYEAAASNEIERAQHFIKEDPQAVNKQDKDGWTPLHFAAYGGSEAAADLLLRKGADVNAVDKGGRTPIHLAALRGKTALVKQLLSERATVDTPDESGMTALHKAAVQGNVDTCEVLLAAGASINAKLKDGASALHLASWKGHTGVVKLLLVKNANYRAVKSNGETPLHEAAEADHEDIVRLLLLAGANVDAQDEEGHTAADLAKAQGHPAIAQLLQKGVKPDPRALHEQLAQATKLDLDPSPSGPAPKKSELPSRFQPFDIVDAPSLTSAAPSVQSAAPSAPPVPAGADWARDLKQAPPTYARPVHYPQLFDPAKVSEAPATEARPDSAWWGRVGMDPQEPTPAYFPQDIRVPDAAPAARYPVTPAAESVFPDAKQEPKKETDPRKQFENNLRKGVQGLAGGLAHGLFALQNSGKKDPKLDEARSRYEAERKKKEDAAFESEWGSRTKTTSDWAGKQLGKQPAHNEKLSTRPYGEDDDDYFEKDAVPSAQEAAPKQHYGQDEQAIVAKQLAQLELQFDRSQGFSRGATKTQAKEAKEAKERMKLQEAQIAAMRRQLEAMQFATTGKRAPVRGSDPYRPPSAGPPAEFKCPITQEVMSEPVIAADGFTYERSAILQWLKLGRTTSPITGQPLDHPGLVSNRALRAAIVQYKMGSQQPVYA